VPFLDRVHWSDRLYAKLAIYKAVGYDGSLDVSGPRSGPAPPRVDFPEETVCEGPSEEETMAHE
jgi:hypothetical protein